MTAIRKSFEEWWANKQSNTPLPWDLKEMFWLAYTDGASYGIKTSLRATPVVVE